jgi:hypothetical protein
VFVLWAGEPPTAGGESAVAPPPPRALLLLVLLWLLVLLLLRTLIGEGPPNGKKELGLGWWWMWAAAAKEEDVTLFTPRRPVVPRALFELRVLFGDPNMEKEERLLLSLKIEVKSFPATPGVVPMADHPLVTSSINDIVFFDLNYRRGERKNI